LVLLVAPLIAGSVSYAVAAGFGAMTTGDPILTSLALLRRLILPIDRSDSWEPMIRALAMLHVQGPPANRLYDTLFFQQHEKFQYAPTSLVWLEGLSHLFELTPANLNRVNALAFVANGIGCALLLRISMRGGAAPATEQERIIAIAAALLLPFVFWPTVYGFTIGQIQVWIDLLVTLAVLSWCRGWKAACGVALGLACTIKPQLGLFLLWGLVWREWQLTIAMAGTLLLWGAESLLLYGVANHVNFLDVLAFIARHGESFRANQSVNGLLNRFLFIGNNLVWDAADFAPFNRVVYWGTLLSSLILTALPLAISLRPGHRASVFDLCFASICFTMASPVAWEHHYGIALPAYIVIAAACVRRGDDVRRWLLAAVVGSWVLVGANLQAFNLLGDTYLNPLQSYVLFGAILLLICLAAIGRSRANDSWPIKPFRRAETDAAAT
jgi:hypothetical protein